MGRGGGCVAGDPLPDRHLQGPAGADGGRVRVPQGRNEAARPAANPRRRTICRLQGAPHKREARLCHALDRVGRPDQRSGIHRQSGRGQAVLGGPDEGPAVQAHDRLGTFGRLPRTLQESGKRVCQCQPGRLDVGRRGVAAQQPLVPLHARRTARPDVPAKPARSRWRSAGRVRAFDGRQAHGDDNGGRPACQGRGAVLRRRQRPRFRERTVSSPRSATTRV